MKAVGSPTDRTRMWAESDAKVEFQVREQAATSIGTAARADSSESSWPHSGLERSLCRKINSLRLAGVSQEP